jgi:hypothetical protein
MTQHPDATLETQDTRRQTTRPQTSSLLWTAGSVLIVLALSVGKAIEDHLASTGMPEFGRGAVSPDQLVPLLFAFAFPLGLSLCGIAALRAQAQGRGGGLASPLVLAVAAAVVTAPVLIPMLIGRELVSHHFGVGGIMITLSALVSFWSIGRLRRGLPRAFVPALDLALLGLLCFGAAAWNLCGTAAMPSFLLMPERVSELQTLPFAIGQMKSVLALFTLGWMLIMAAAMIAAWRMKARA